MRPILEEPHGSKSSPSEAYRSPRNPRKKAEYVGILTRWARIWIYWSLADGGVKAVEQERYRACCVVFGSNKRMTGLWRILSEYPTRAAGPSWQADFRFTSFMKIGSGMSYEDYQWMMWVLTYLSKCDLSWYVRTKHKTHWKPFDRKNPPSWLKLGQMGLDDKRESTNMLRCRGQS